MDYNQIKNLIPNGITAIRLILIPFFLWAYFSNLVLIATVIFIFSVVTDAIDGYLARKLGSTSLWGAYFDVTADFIFIFAVFGGFVINGVYPFWILIIILFMFLQFILSSKTKFLTYDPLGKYYGSFLFLVIFLTLITTDIFLDSILLLLVVVFTIISILSRFFFFLVRRNKYI